MAEPEGVVATAPVRVADCGGWTDTWFAGGGVVCNVAVGPGVTVRVTPDASNTLTLDGTCAELAEHPLIAAALRQANGPLHVDVVAHAPPGSGAGTSAALTVALLAALDALAGSTTQAGFGTRAGRTPAELAAAAHAVETVDLGLQSGVQDQLAAAHGGASLVAIDAYPAASVRRLAVPTAAWTALGQRLVTVYLGRPHQSSAVHEQVIADLETGTGAQRLLQTLRDAARAAAAALESGDLVGYGAALTANTAAQAALHPLLVSDDAHRMIAAARSLGALGWKVNGAGGDGGSLTILCGAEPNRVRQAADGLGYAVLDLVPTDAGVRVSGAGSGRFGSPGSAP